MKRSITKRSIWRKTSLAAATIGALATIVVAVSSLFFERILPGDLLISSIPNGAQVYVNDEFQGKAPLKISLKPGFYRVSALVNGYEKSEKITQIRSRKPTQISFTILQKSQKIDLSTANDKIDTLLIKLNMLENRIKNIKIPTDSEVSKLSEDVQKTKSDFTSLKKMILEEPEKSLTLPLLKKDIDLIKESNKSMRSEVDKIFSLTKWFIGTLLAMAVGLLGLVISIITGKK